MKRVVRSGGRFNLIDLIGWPARDALRQLGYTQFEYDIKWAAPDEGVFSRGYVAPKKNGIECVLSGETDSPMLFCVHIELDEYARRLILGLDRQDGLEQVTKKLGHSFKTGGGTSHPLLGDIQPWASYQLREHICVTLEFTSDKISKMSLFDTRFMMAE